MASTPTQEIIEYSREFLKNIDTFWAFQAVM